MDKKSLILIIVCIVVFAFVCLSYAGIFNHEDTFQVGDVNFKLPEGYKYAGVNDKGFTKITNGVDVIYFVAVDDKDIDLHVNNYLKSCESQNKTATISNFTTNDIFVYKANCSDKSNEYWFVSGEKTYAFFTTKETSNIDDIARYLIDSI